MNRFLVLVLLSVALVSSCLADEPVAPTGKLLAAEVELTPAVDAAAPPSAEAVFSLYESSKASAAIVTANWGDVQQSESASFDFAPFDNQVSMKSAKTKICWLGLANKWADGLKQEDPERYWKFAEAFVTALVKRAADKGISHFSASRSEPDAAGDAAWAASYVQELKHIHRAAKAAKSDCVLIAGGFSNGSAETIQAFYDADAKGSFDVLDIHAYTSHSTEGVDIWQVISAARAMARNDDSGKKIFVGAGWGPKAGVHGVPRNDSKIEPSKDEIEVIRAFVANGLRNLLTKRDIYDPDWVLGATYSSFNDHYAGGSFINNGLVDFAGKSKGDLVVKFPPEIPRHRFEATLTAPGPAFNYVVEKPYELELKFTNLTAGEIRLVSWGVTAHGPRPITATPVGESDATVSAGNSASRKFTVTLPKEAAGKQVTLIGRLDYVAGGEDWFTDCWATVSPTPELEITLLPTRAILDGGEESKRVGLSVINHADTPFEGKITFTATPGLSVTPESNDIKIDPFGLEAMVFMVTPQPNIAPGHYTVWVDVGGKVKDWVAVDVPVTLKRDAIKLDGKLDDWKSIPAVRIARFVGENDGKGSYADVGKARFAYDEKNLYALVEVNDAKHVQGRAGFEITKEDSIQIGFDALLNGALTSGGGYREDDSEFAFAQTSAGPVAMRLQAPEGKQLGAVSSVTLKYSRDGGTDVYEIAVPWSEIGATPAPGKAFALGIAVNDFDGQKLTTTEWGGGITPKRDPRLFIPIVLGD